jgi:glycosyltransferase involved in cell wall biosynthesis
MSGGAAQAGAPIRVLWLIKGLGPGGAEQLLVNHARVRDRVGFDCRAAYLVPVKCHLVPSLEAEDIEVTALEAPNEWDPRWVIRLRRLLRDRPVDVVHGHSPYVAAVTRLVVRTLPRATRPALVYTEHNRWPRHRPVTRVANRLTIGLDDVDLAVSEDVRASMPPRVRARTEVVVHGIDIDAVRAKAGHRREVREQLGIADDEVVIGTVANLRREKGYDVLLDAAQRLDADPGETKVRIVSVGQGPLEADLRAEVEARGLQDRVLLLGYREDAVATAAAFDVFTLASRHEGLPVSLMEALALGLPVVATRAGGIPEMVTDGVEGLLVPVDDAAALAHAWRRVADDTDLRNELARCAHERAAAFAVAPAVRTIEAHYRVASSRS